MEFVEEESRPRFLFQSRTSSSSPSDPLPETLKPSKLHLASCFSAAFLLLFLALSPLFSSQSQTLAFVLIWTALSLLVAPFAPSSATGGDPRVGLGDPLPSPPPSVSSDSDDNPPARRTRSRPKPDNPHPAPALIPAPAPKPQDPTRIQARSAKVDTFEGDEQESKEWTDEDFEILKKQISKHPVGEPRRWEKIAEGFNGRHGLESVIKMGKSMADRRPEAKDSFSQFLKQRKPLDKRVESLVDDEVRESATWSSGEDIALLNALKAFPKDAPMRWEKVAAAVPGRSKAECVKRVGELKRDFRSSKAS